MAESFVSLSVENDDVKCLVYNRKVHKKKKKFKNCHRKNGEILLKNQNNGLM